MKRNQRSSLRTILCLERLEDRCLLSAGALDLAFDGDGIVTTNVGLAGYGAERITAVALQPDGKIIAVGYAATETSPNGAGYRSDIAVVRYDTDGALDNTFSGDGKATTSWGKNLLSRTTEVAVQHDGKILVSGIGTPDFAVLRYKPDGTLDTPFGGKGTGIVTTPFGKNSIDYAYAMELQSDHKIVLAGVTTAQNSSTTDLALVRYKLDGTLDTSFSGDGKVTTRFAYSVSIGNYDAGLKMAVYANDPIRPSPHADKLVVVCLLQDGSVIVARYLPNGDLDPDFGVGRAGYVTLAGFGDRSAPLVAIQADDAIVVGRGGMYLARLQPNGILDPAFGTAGIAHTPLEGGTAESMAIQTDGKIVLGLNVFFDDARQDKMVVARFNTNGSLDDGLANDSTPGDSFGDIGIATGINISTGAIVTHVQGMAIQADGKIVIGGQVVARATGDPIDFALARFLGDDPPTALLAASAPERAVGQMLSRDQVEPLLAEAFARWQSAGVVVSSLHGIDIRIADLGGTTLGLASGNTIWLDDNAAGWGWFVDATPGDDSEFTIPGDQGEQNRIDLLTILMHELGHVLGHEHDEGGVMAETLTAGMRLTPLVDATDWLAAVDVVFSKKPSSPRGWW